MALVFPTGKFGFNDQEVNIEGQTLRGGRSLAGEEDRISTDGGGRVFAEFGGGELIDRETVLAWRALTTVLEEGITPVEVPFCDPRHQPVASTTAVPHSDGTPFSDGALYQGVSGTAETTGAAPLRATALDLALSLAVPLIGGEWFSIEHPTKGWRAYRVRTVESPTRITFRPPLREAVGAGEAVDFSNPRCLMVSDEKISNRISLNRRLGAAAVRFIEAP